MNPYKLKLIHDGGEFNLTVYATDIEAAKRIVMAAEGCPENAIQC